MAIKESAVRNKERDRFIIFLERNQRFGTTYLSHLQGLLDYLDTLEKRQTNSPETLISCQKMTPGENPKAVIQHHNRSGILQSHM